jgi:hypothetical protein
MALKYSEALRDAGLDARIKAIGPKPRLCIFADSKKCLVEIDLPEGWMSKAKGGAVHKEGEWFGTAAASGEARRFAIIDAMGEQISGEIPLDMTLDDPQIEKHQIVVVGSFTISGAGRG